MNRSTPDQLLEFTQTHIHRVSDAIQPSHPLSSPSPPASNPSQHQCLFQWVNSSQEVAKVLEFVLATSKRSGPILQNEKVLELDGGDFCTTIGVDHWTVGTLVCVLGCSVMSDSLRPHRLEPARLLCPWRFSRQKYWSGLPGPPPADLPNPGIKPRSPTL